MKSYYDLMKMPHEEAEKLVGCTFKFPNSTANYLVISLDEYFANCSGFGTKYTVMSTIQYFPTSANVVSLGILGIDDCNFHANFKPTAEMNWSILEEKAHEWAARQNYRNINCHALEDYCRYLQPGVEFDWN